MSQILVRKLEPDLVQSLKTQAKNNGRSLQSEVKAIIVRGVNRPRLDHKAALKLLDEIRARYKGRKFTDSVELIREDRDR